MKETSQKGDWAARVLTLRGAESQTAFARRFGLAQPTVSAWERGLLQDEPARDRYVELANVALQKSLYAEAKWFFEKGGVDFDLLVPLAERSIGERRFRARPGHLISIRPVAQSQSSRESESAGIEFPERLISRPGYTKYLRVSGKHMAPMFKPGDMLLIDESETDPWNLEEQWVAVHREPGALSLHELSVKDLGRKKLPVTFEESIEQAALWESGIAVGILRSRPEGETNLLVLESMKGSWGSWWEVIARDSRGVDRQRVPGWTIIGRVVLWSRGPLTRRKDRKTK